MHLQLNWIRCGEQQLWCQLEAVDLTHSHFDNLGGVYIIWHGGTSPATVRVGQGMIRDRLTAHRNDVAITKYRDQGLFVTWAKVPVDQRDGVERYLADRLQPEVGTVFPGATPVPVNLPWDA